MITYVDTSTFVKVVIDEPGTAAAFEIWEQADAVTSAALIRVEARSALAAARRARRLSSQEYGRARETSDRYLRAVTFVGIGEMLIERASEHTEDFALRGYDAVHLAAAELVGAEVFSSSDRALCAAARQLSFHVANPLDG